MSFASRRARNHALAATAAGLLLLGLATLPARATTGPALVTLPSAVLPGIGGLTPSSAVAGTQAVTLTLAVAGDDAALQRAYQAIYTPGGSDYHHFLTTTQVADRFGAPLARWQAVQHWLTAGGLALSYVSPGRDLIEATGPAVAVEHLLNVQLDNYQVGAERFLANTAPPTVPASLGVTDILGLNTLERLARAGLSQPSKLGRLLSLGGENIGIQTPQDIWGAYNEPAADEGAGQTLGMFGEGDASGIASDLAAFDKSFGLPAVPVTLKQVGAGPFTDTSGRLEWNLDTQAESGMAPAASGIDMYFGSDLSDASVAAMFSDWQSDPAGPAQMNASFGGCEETPVSADLAAVLNPISNLLATAGIGISVGDNLQTVTDPVLEKANLEGRTLFASAGDTGSSCPVIALPGVGAGNGLVNQLVPLTNYPASSPFAVGVGGTVLYTKGSGTSATRALEYAWTFGGGGDTLFIPAPSYQHGVANLDLPCLATAAGGTSAAGQLCRGVPDVSAMSGDVLTNAYPIVSKGAATVEGGTSLSSPLWVGIWTRVQAASTAAGGNGFANETFYRLGRNPTTYARDFFDVTTGLLGLPVVGNGLYPTQKGWDYATGWGTPNLANLITDTDG